MAEPLLTLSQVSKYYTGNQSVVVGLNNITLSFSRGEFVAVTGESGSGKSTLSHVIGGILPYESGEMYFKGAETSHFDSADWERYRRDNISFISQNYGILPSATVMSNVVSALILSGMEKAEAKVAAEKILRQVELWDMRRRRAAKLSSGQKQRLSIARALAKPAPILIADEPTGNLDPENSAKVIALLAEAAKERLVILVTHEFDEAKDSATRHIILQDGKVASDTALRPAVTAPESKTAVPASSGRKRVLSPYVARLQYSSRPVWTTIMVLLFAVTAFSVFAFLGVFIISLDDTSTRIYDDSAFRNGSTDRLVVMRGDLGTFTAEDFETIISLSHVNAIEKNGYVTDAQYAYRDGVDYITTYTETEYRGGAVTYPYILLSYEMTVNAPFIKTVSMLQNSDDLLTGGRLPADLYEVVSADKKLGIGDTVKVFLTDSKNWDYGSKVEIEVTVVGVTDQGSGLYFHEDIGLFMRNTVGSIYQPSYDPKEMLVSPVEIGDGIWERRDYPRQLVEVSYDEFYEFVDTSGSDQISVTIDGYGYTDRVIADLNAHGYTALSPYRLGSTEQIPERVAERTQTLRVCLAALAAVVVLQIVLLRAMFGLQTESYRLLSNIGLVSSVAGRSIVWQVAVLTAAGQLLGYLGIWISAYAGVVRMRELLSYLPPSYLLLLSAVHVAASALSAIWIIRALGRQVYPLSKKFEDIAI